MTNEMWKLNIKVLKESHEYNSGRWVMARKEVCKMVGIDKAPFECCISEDFKQEVSRDEEMLDDGLGDLVAIEGSKHIINLHVMEQ